MIGIAKAKVLPEPVGALASTSFPASVSSSTRVWIGKVVSMPLAARASMV